jgi:flagellar motor switch protein FliG
MKDRHRTLRKAAVLVASLEPERAEAILAQMTPAQANSLRAAVADLGPLDPAEQSEVIEEFFRIGPLVPARDVSGIELDSPHCAELLPQSAPAPSSAALQPCKRGTARVWQDAPADALVAYLEREQSQTIALVVSRLPSRLAAEVLAGLPAERQVEVARRVVELGEADPAIVDEIERGLETWLAERNAVEQRRADGMIALGNILESANPLTREHILANLAGREPGLVPPAESPPPPTIRFADIEQFDATTLRALLRGASTQILVLALAGARPEFAQRALAQLPVARSQVLARALCNLGPTRLADIEEAQQQLASLAGRLQAGCDVTAASQRHLSVAV